VAAEYTEIHGRGTTYEWKVVIVLANGTRLPLTPMASTSPLHLMAAEEAQRFLGLPVGDVVEDSPGEQRRTWHHAPASREAIALYAAALFVASIFAGRYLWTFAYSYVSARPIRVTIVSGGVESYHVRSGTRYHPRIAYRYVVNGDSLTGLRLHLSGFDDGTVDEANAWVSAYPVGEVEDAWLAPNDSDGPYLIRDWNFVSLMLFGVSAYFAAYFAWTWRAMAPRPPRG
jgi:hypothetical protein